MNTIKVALATLFVSVNIGVAKAGGLLTNTNQSISFLRNPAREAAIGIDGVYSNPAGVAFLGDGFHIGLNWQTASQTRTCETTSPYLDHTLSLFDEEGKYISGSENPTKRYRGHAAVPFIPSVSAAYNKSRWSFQFHFAVAGGGGKCEFEKGLGTFEQAVGQIATQLKALGVMGYGCDNYMEGRQYYYGVTLGAAYKVTDNLSVYGGVRALIANASYTARIKDIQVSTSDGLLTLSDFIDYENNYFKSVSAYLDKSEAEANAAITLTKPYYDQYGAAYDQLKAVVEAGLASDQQKQLLTAIEGYKTAVAGLETIAATRKKVAEGQDGIDQLTPYRDGVDLQCDQTGFGIAPIIGVDWKVGRFNLAAKYEFRTNMSLLNKSNLKEATLDATAQFVDGTKVREDCPALFTVGAQYSPIDMVRINAGYHHFFDKDSKKYGDKQELLSHGTNEYLGGVEVDLTERLTVSGGVQLTRYGLSDGYMSDLSFVTNSWSFGFGASYQANPNVKIEAAYFKTLYSHYKTASTAQGITNDFSRTNDVIGVGLVIDL